VHRRDGTNRDAEDCHISGAGMPVTAASGGEITTVAPGRKFAPTSVILTWSAPCIVNSGETLIRLGERAMLTVSGTALEISTPVPKILATVTCSVAGVAISDAKTVAVSCSVLLYTVGRLLPLICTTEFVFVKPLPVTVNVKVWFPAATEAGLIVVITGAVCALPTWHIPVKATSRKRVEPRGAGHD